jgi:DNA-directed RNA polymerase subunit K/omega
VVQRPVDVGRFQFAVLSSLRAKQLTRGCTPKVGGNHKNTIIAQIEVADGLVRELLVTAAEGAPVGQEG